MESLRSSRRRFWGPRQRNAHNSLFQEHWYVSLNWYTIIIRPMYVPCIPAYLYTIYIQLYIMATTYIPGGYISVHFTVYVNLTGRFAIWHTYCTWHHNTRNIFPRHSFGPVEDGRPSSPYVLAYVIIATFFNLHCIHSQLYSLVYIDLHLSESIVTLNKNPKINSSNINRCRTFGCNLKIMSRNQVTKRSFQEISNGGDRDKNKRNKLGTSGWKKYSARDKSRWPEFLQMRDRKLRAEKMTYLHRIRY